MTRSGTRPDAGQVGRRAAVIVAATAATTLPLKGSMSGLASGIALGLVGAGAALAVVIRRRRRPSPES